MRILLVNAHGADLAAGGSERYVADLAAGLASRGHDVHVLSAFPVRKDGAESTTVLHATHWRDSRARRYRNHLGDLVSIPTRGVRDAIAAARPDLVHTGNLPGLATGVWEQARRLGLPLVHTLHDYHLLCPRSTLTRRDGSACCPHPRFCALRTRRLARWAPAVSHVIAGSNHLIEREGQLFPNARFEVVRVPFVPVAGRALRPPAAPPRSIGYLGGLDVIKGIRELLAAAPELARLGLRVRLAGDGRLRGDVEAATGPDVEYVGPVLGKQKVAFIEQADVAICPSTWEEANGPPYVVAEWLAAARPVLCSTRGGLAEAASLPGVVAIEATAEGIVAGVRRAIEEWGSLSRLAPVTDSADMERWLDEHEAVYERASTSV
ncbi:MAG TPA: glycosyltransferase [Gaiellaceae bacterium]|nr:glycosyltransferase [Gaiellaceae bacterium]